MIASIAQLSIIIDMHDAATLKEMYESTQRRSECRWGNMTAKFVEVVHVLVPFTGEGIQGDRDRIGCNSRESTIKHTHYIHHVFCNWTHV